MSDHERPDASHVVDRRMFGRRTTCKPAKILADGCSPIGCTLVDLSEGGAGLQLSPDIMLPSSFNLLVEADDIVVLCRLVHRTHNKVGVEFLRSPRRASRLTSQSAINARQYVRKVLGGNPPK